MPNKSEQKQNLTSEIFVEQARKWVGRNESDGTHRHIVDIYNNHKPLARGYSVKYTDSWCATFVSAVAIKSCCTNLVPTECSCQNQIELFKKINSWIEDDSYVPKVGDIIYYDWQDKGTGDNTGWSDHVGIVEKIDGNYMTIIEGNYNDSVGRRVLQINGKYLRGYGVPKYDAEVIANNATATTKKSIDEIAQDVIEGKYGNGEIRKKKIESEGYDYEEVRTLVNQIIEEQKYYPKYTGNSKKVDDVLREIGVSEIYVGNKTKRKPVGKANGFPSYTGKQNENLAIIYLAKQGKLKKP